MVKNTQKQATDQPSPDQMLAQFAALWQEKWAAMLQEKGWPADQPPPTLATMPFANPFMMSSMMPGLFGASPQPDHALLMRIVALEARVAQLEQPKKATKKKS